MVDHAPHILHSLPLLIETHHSESKETLSMRTKLLILTLVATLVAATLLPAMTGQARAATVAVPVASATRLHPAAFDRTRFLLHAGVAFYAFHHFVYARYRAGQLNTAHKLNLLKAAAALLFGVHEARVAYGIAKTSHSRTLLALAAPFETLSTAMDSVRYRLSKGQYNSADITGLNKSVDAINGQARKTDIGQINDVNAPIPAAA